MFARMLQQMWDQVDKQAEPPKPEAFGSNAAAADAVKAAPSAPFASGLGGAGGILGAFAEQLAAQQQGKPAREPGEQWSKYEARVKAWEAKKEGPKAGWKRDGVGATKTSFEGEAGSRNTRSTTVGTSGVAHSRARQSGGVEDSWGVGAKLGGPDTAAVSGKVGQVRARDAEGKATDATEASATLGWKKAGAKLSRTEGKTTRSGSVSATADGVSLGASTETGGVTTGGSLVVADGHYGAGVSVGKDKGPNASMSFAMSEDGYKLGMTAGGKYAKAGFNYASMDDKQVAGHSAAGTSLVSSLLGASTVGYGLMDAESIGGSLEISNGWLGIGAQGSKSESSSVHAHTTIENLLADLKADPDAVKRAGLAGGPMKMPVDLSNLDAAKLEKLSTSHPEVYRELLASQLRRRVDGADGLEDLDLAGMRGGDAFTLQSGEGWSAGGSVTVGVKASLGVEGQDAEQVTIAKTGDETYAVQLSAMDSDALKASLGVGDTALSMTDRDTDSTELAFEVTGPEGLAALQEFQRTGLLPGAERAVKDPKALDAVEQARRELEEARETGFPFAVAAAEEELRERVGAVNSQMMKGDLDLTALSAAIPGVQYTTRRLAQTEEDKGGLSLFGLSFLSWSWGSTHTRWDEQFRQGGRDQWARGSKHDEDNVFAADETSMAVLNPNGAFLTDQQGNKHEIELAMFTDQAMNKRQRQLLDDAGGLKGEIGALREHWLKDGWTDDAPTTQVRMAWTQAHFDLLEQATAREGGLWSQASAGVGSFFEKSLDARIFRSPGMFGVSSGDQVQHWDNIAYDDAAGSVMNDVMKEWGVELRTKFVGLGDQELDDSVKAELAAHQARLEKVDSPEKFRELSKNEQRLLLTSTALEAIAGDRDPWQAAVMAMQVKDPDLRNQHLRELFHVIEERKPDTHAMLDFVKHIQEAKYLKADEREALLGTLEVNIADKRVDRRTAEIDNAEDTASFVAAKVLKDSADLRDDDMHMQMKMGGMIGDTYRLQQKMRGDDTVDWLQAARKAGGPQLVEKVIREAKKSDPDFVWKTLERVREVDPRRADVLYDIIGETATGRAQQEKAREWLSGFVPWA